MAIRDGDYGFTLRITVEEDGVAVDISTMTLADSLFLVPPKGATKTRTPAFNGTGVDGILDYVVAAGDIDQVGRWRAQVAVALGSGLTVKSEGLIVDVQRVGA